MENQTQKFIIDVIPLTRISLSRQQFFSYVHHEEIPAGTLVAVPFFRRNLEGIVLGSRSDFHRLGNFELKKITAVLAPEFLTSCQLELAQFISEHYYCSLGIALRHFVPQRVKERSKDREPKTENKIVKNIALTKEQSFAVEKITKPIFETHKNVSKFEIRNSKFLLHGPASSGKTEVYIHAMRKITRRDPTAQFLVLVPELTLTPQAIERYSAYFDPKEIVLLHSKLGKGTFFTNWEKIRSGEAKIIVGTRAALFAPFARLRLIVVDEEQDISFKQWDMQPRYDARKCAEFLAASFDASFVLGSATPRIETFWRAQQNELQKLVLPRLALPGEHNALQVELVDMRKEKWTDFAGKKKPNYSFLSLKLQSEISYALTNKLQTILFINHQGMNAFSVCTSCKAVLKCPNCNRALVYDENGQYKCLHCAYSSDILTTCPVCHGMQFRHVGLGTQAVAREVKKLFPYARILRADAASVKKPGAQIELYEKFKNKEADIMIGTQMITKGWDLPNVGLVAIIDADNMQTIPDFTNDERVFEHIVQAAGRTGRIGSKFKGMVIIQTYDPLDGLLQKVKDFDYQAFYLKELENRQTLFYPPFAQLIKLVCQNADAAKLSKESAKIFEKINRITDEAKHLAAYGPQDPLISKIRGRWRKQILIKNKLPEQALPSELTKILQNLGSDWFVDVDPLGTL